MPGSTARPESASRRGSALLRLGGGQLGLADERLDPQDRQHPLRPDERARHLVDRLGCDAERDHEKGGVAVEGDELAGADRALDGEPATEPRDDDDEDAGQEHLGRIERRLGERHPDAGAPDLFRPPPVAVEEDALAADAAEHAQAGHRVGPDGGEPADLLALLPLAGLQRPDHEREGRDEDGNAEQDDEAEERRRRQQHGGDDEVRGDRTRKPRRDVEGAAGAQGVIRDGRDHFAGRQPPADRRPGQRRVVGDDLDHAEARLEPVADRDAVAERAGHRLDDAEPEQHARPAEQ